MVFSGDAVAGGAVNGFIAMVKIFGCCSKVWSGVYVGSQSSKPHHQSMCTGSGILLGRLLTALKHRVRTVNQAIDVGGSGYYGFPCLVELTQATLRGEAWCFGITGCW